MGIKLAVFDVDGTLAGTEEVIPPHIGVKLRAFESKGLRIVLISGRTSSYLAGLARGIGIRKPIVAGENGGVIFNPLDLWEKKLDEIPLEIISEMMATLKQKIPDLWFQPNQTMLTAAPLDLGRIDELYEEVRQLKQVSENGYKLNKYYDAVEVMPKGNSKGKALAAIKKFFGFEKKEVIVLGNTAVDLPMKEEAEEFLFIGDYPADLSIKNYSSIEEALEYLEEVIDYRD